METRRCLLSLAVPHGSGFEGELHQICCTMNAPKPFLEAIGRFLPSAGHVHFGFERSGKTLIGKCYLELPTSEVAPENARERLQFLGFKWSMDDPATAVVTRYRSVTPASWMDLSTIMLNGTCENLRPGIRRLLRILQPDGELIEAATLLEIEEEGSSRKSWDLNLYDRQYCLSGIAEPWRQWCEVLGLPSSESEQWLHQHQSEHLGHVATGVGRNGQSFVTIYYGAQPFTA
jgi:tryptophan halogenase